MLLEENKLRYTRLHRQTANTLTIFISSSFFPPHPPKKKHFLSLTRRDWEKQNTWPRLFQTYRQGKNAFRRSALQTYQETLVELKKNIRQNWGWRTRLVLPRMCILRLKTLASCFVLTPNHSKTVGRHSLPLTPTGPGVVHTALPKKDPRQG